MKVSYTRSRQVAIEAPFGGTVHHPTAAATFFSDRAQASRIAIAAADSTTSVLARNTAPNPAPRDQTQRRVGKSQREVEKSSVGAHGEATAFRGRATDRFHAKAGVNERVAEPGECRPEERERRPRRNPDQSLASRLDQHADQRNAGAADLVRQVPEHDTPGCERDAQEGESKPGVGPPMLDKEQHDGCRDRAEADAAQRQPETGHADGTEHSGESGAGIGWRCDGAKRRDEQQGDERDQRRRERDRREAVAGVQGGAGRRADGVGDVHRGSDPGHDLARVLRACERQPPTERSGDDEALRSAEQCPAQQQDGDGCPRSADELEREKVEQPRHRADQQADDDCALGAAAVGVSARPEP